MEPATRVRSDVGTQAEVVAGADAAAEAEAEAARVLDLLATRDAAWLPIRLGYAVWTVPGEPRDASAIELAGATKDREGTLWWDGRSVSTEFELFARARATSHVTIDWMPGTCKSVIRDLLPARSNAWPALRIVGPKPSPYLDCVGPLEYGLAHLNRSWKDIRALSTRLRVRGRETVLSRDCVRIGLEYGAAVSSGKSVPTDLWIDDRDTLLVLRTETYALAQALDEQDWFTQDDLRASAFDRDGVSVVPTARWEALELVESGGRWIARVGRHRSFGSLLPDTCRLAIVDASTVEFGAAAPVTDFTLPAGGGHFDEFSGDHYVVAEGEARLTTEQGRYWNMLEKLGQTNIRSNGALPAADLDFDNSTCGANAALLVSHLNGRWCSLDALHGAAHIEPRPGGDNDLSEVQRMVEAQGLEARAVETDLEALADWNGYVIAHTRASHPNPEPGSPALDKHFLVAKVRDVDNERVVEFVSPPGSVNKTSPELFATIWTGRALLVADGAAPIDEFIRRHASSRASRWLPLAGVAASALLLAWLWSTRVQARRGAALERSGAHE